MSIFKDAKLKCSILEILMLFYYNKVKYVNPGSSSIVMVAIQ